LPRRACPPFPHDAVAIHREGITTAAAEGRVTPAGLRKLICITLLHELAHHFGMTEEELQALGYG
jgi:predicted Zn-dependent protease with MMP-like domain